MKKPTIIVPKAETLTKHLHGRKRMLARGERHRVKSALRVGHGNDGNHGKAGEPWH